MDEHIRRFLGAGLVVFALSLSGTARAITLDEVMTQAVARSYDLQIAHKDIDISKSDLKITRLQMATENKIVLNALRHQRVDRGATSQASRTGLSAQRLTASKGGSVGGWRSFVVGDFCAQRLTASKGGSELVAKYGDFSKACSTPYGIKGWIGNARKNDRFCCSECSTPYGIKGWIGLRVKGNLKNHIRCSTPYGIKGWIGPGIP